jgi:hypothetical protein
MPGVPLLRKQIIATVDDVTTMVCLDAAGQIRPIDQPFHTIAGEFQHPPFHIWCRSVVIPYLEGFITGHRQQANAEISRRPLEHRRKGPTGIGAPIPPPPHGATHDRRFTPIALTDDTDLLTRAAGEPDDLTAAALTRYLDDEIDTDRQLRTGDLDEQHRQLIDELDTALRTSGLTETLTVFASIDNRLLDDLETGDILADDTYLKVTLDPAVAARHGRPLALTLPTGQHALVLDPRTQQLLLPRRHSWRLVALGAILVGVLL